MSNPAPFVIESGIQIPLLNSTTHFRSWKTRFETIARKHNIWQFFSGEANLLAKPDLPVQPCLHLTHPTADEYAREGLRLLDLQGMEDLEEEYEYAFDEYQQQQDRIGCAIDLLVECVSEVYHQKVYALGKKPQQVWSFIMSEFTQSDWQRQLEAYEGFDNIKYAAGETMTHYFQRYRQAQHEIRIIDGLCPDGMIIAKLGQNLPMEYDEWVEKIIKGEDKPNLPELLSSLLAKEKLIEFQRQMRRRRQVASKKEKKTKVPNPPKCTQPNCIRRKGHTSDRCYTAFPHLREEDEKAKKAAAAVVDGGKVNKIKQAIATATVSVTSRENDNERAASPFRPMAVSAWFSPDQLAEFKAHIAEGK